MQRKEKGTKWVVPNGIDDATYELTNLTNSIITKVIQRQEKDNARANNTAALKTLPMKTALKKRKLVTVGVQLSPTYKKSSAPGRRCFIEGMEYEETLYRYIFAGR